CVADDVLAFTSCLHDGAPLHPSRKCSTATPPEPGLRDFAHDLLRCHGQCPLEAIPATMGRIIVERKRISEAYPSECKAFQLLEIRDLFCQAMAERMIPTLQKSGFRETGNILYSNWPIRDPTRIASNFHQGFQPQQAARTIADQPDFRTTCGCLGNNGLSHGIGAHRNRRGVTRNIYGNWVHGCPSVFATCPPGCKPADPSKASSC